MNPIQTLLCSLWDFLGKDQTFNLIALAAFAAAFWELYQNRLIRTQDSKLTLIQWRAEMYESAFANITLYWESLHDKFSSFQVKNHPLTASSIQLNDLELRLLEVKFRFRGSDNLHNLIGDWSESASAVMTAMMALSTTLSTQDGIWNPNDQKFLAEIGKELENADSIFYDIEKAMTEELKLPLSVMNESKTQVFKFKRKINRPGG
jgi:hypothetical protein